MLFLLFFIVLDFLQGILDNISVFYKPFFVIILTCGLDIDFYIPSTGTLIQVAYSIEGDAYDREINNLKKAYDKIEGVSRLVIITHSEKNIIPIGNIDIEVIPAYRCLT